MSIHEEQTLHDFVLGLLNDPASRLEFTQDPTHVLECAGLGDITAQDVQEVVPLVMDYSGQLPGADALGGDLPADVAGLDGAIAQLRTVADAAGQGRSDDSLDLGGFDAELGGTAEGIAGAGELFTDHLDAVGAATASTEGGAVASAIDSDAGSGEFAGEASEDGASFASSGDSLLGHFAGIGGAGLESSGGALAYEGDAATGSGMLDASLDGVTGDLSFVTEQGGVAGFADGSADGAAGGVALESEAVEAEGIAGGSTDEFAAGGELESPLGTYGVEFAGEPADAPLPDFATTGDLAGALDSESLTRGAEPAASTLATYVTSDGAALGGLAPVQLPAAEQLPAELPAARGDLPADIPADIPAGAGDLPVDLPAAPAPGLPDVGSVPVDVPADVPAELPTDLPAGLPAELPTELPELPVANPLPAARGDLPADTCDPAGTVTDSVGSSPLGDVPNATEALPTDVPNTGDLGLGL
ncbi:IniB N-terminal domain-containing protein [Prauserella endophytica]|uniref:Uncharacterized protein n=1 Tax=Prauserella endophytica TaxID=1592324 RepID=A0ABY2S4R7_9PSEU|nr:IniB N-terminal domain-containing protein [Prauserella endophytica]TKG69920.1 hypothetical protein FCN18_17500 [Prauserella endophytica]